MVRAIGSMLLVVAMAFQANAALLVSYEFNSDTKAVVSNAVVSAADFNSSGGAPAAGSSASYGVVNGQYVATISPATTLLTNYVTVRVQNTATNGTSLYLNSLSYDLENGSASGGSVLRNIIEGSQWRKGSTGSYTNVEGGSVVAPGGLVSSFRAFSTDQDGNIIPLVLTPGEFVEIRLIMRRSGLTTSTGLGRTFKFDNFTIDGDVVPEPASIAIFGALGLGLVARRCRKK